MVVIGFLNQIFDNIEINFYKFKGKVETDTNI